jgi:hypothetical protein
MQSFVVEYYDLCDPSRIFVKQITAATTSEAPLEFLNDPDNGGTGIYDIYPGKFDKEAYRIIRFD